MNCRNCENYLTELEVCKFCSYESLPERKWDIFNLPDWSHIEIQQRLADKGIESVYVDCYFDNNVAFILGCFADTLKIAKALNLNPDSVYAGNDKGIVILNLYMEKAYRLGIDVDKEWELMPCIMP